MNIKKYRIEKGLTQDDLAFTTGLSLRQIQELESGRVSPRHVKADTMLRISYTLNVPIKNLMGAIYDSDSGKFIYDEDFIWLIPEK